MTRKRLLPLNGQIKELLHLKEHFLVQHRELVIEFINSVLKCCLLIVLDFLLVECDTDVPVQSDFPL